MDDDLTTTVADINRLTLRVLLPPMIEEIMGTPASRIRRLSDDELAWLADRLAAALRELQVS